MKQEHRVVIHNKPKDWTTDKELVDDYMVQLKAECPNLFHSAKIQSRNIKEQS